MRLRTSTFLVVSTLVLATAWAADDAHKCSASARECEQQIRMMLSGRRYLGAQLLETDHGLYVKNLTPQSPADRAGLTVGDRLMSVNGKNTVYATNVDFKRIVGEAKDTGRLWLLVARRGTLKHIEIRMEPIPKEQIDKIVEQHMTSSHQPQTAGQ